MEADQQKRKERNEERDFLKDKLDWVQFENRVRRLIQVTPFPSDLSLGAYGTYSCDGT